ncbi:sex-determining region Y protein-like isoform X3 [Phyllopteryx taeniolatus]|uniref:sex-determining region Y protein-like isoform X3 n=1 Tax=Phyllopteryx taeniolatus TaxID=161469 RepID=UPI002AD3BAB7|nr:sex-determining region Y protein-like isoform X3 [Phyllopteryx taeniolatus]
MEDVVTLHEADWNDLLQVINNHDQQPWQVSAYLETVAATHQLPAQQIQLINSAPGLLMEVHPNPVRVINQLIPQTILAPTLPNSTSLELTQKKKLVTDDRPYIKKPLNAFLIFLKEHRANVKKIFKDKDSATVNKVLGQMWKSLTLIQKEKYFRESDRLNEEHVRKYPEWSCRDNYHPRPWWRPLARPTRTSVNKTFVHRQTAQVQSLGKAGVIQEASQLESLSSRFLLPSRFPPPSHWRTWMRQWRARSRSAWRLSLQKCYNSWTHSPSVSGQTCPWTYPLTAEEL